MAPPDAMETTDPDGEAQTRPPSQVTSHDTFHLYPDLPFELRAPIRAFAIKHAIPTYTWGLSPGDSLSCSRLAVVSKEWQDDVEKAMFRKIRVDPLNEEEISEFKQNFTDRRKKYLTQLEVTMDDGEQTGLWERKGGLLDISQLMEKTGQLFQQLSGWSFSTAGNEHRSIAVMFTSRSWCAGRHPLRSQAPDMGTRSLWDLSELRRAARNGMPTNVALWAIKSEFPSSMNMVTHLTFVPDCVPISAAKRILQVMPNLKSCTFETCFSFEVEEAWRDFTDFIHQLRASAPSLRTLRLNAHTSNFLDNEVPASMVVFTNALRKLSQSLEYLDAAPFVLHEAFFLPFSAKADADTAASGSHCTWPKLQSLTLRGFWELPSWGPDRATLTSVDILIAAAKASLSMPNLERMEIATPGAGHFIFVRDFHGFRESSICLAGFSEDEERSILAACAHLIGTKAKLDMVLARIERPPVRLFKALKEGSTGS